MAFCGQCGNRVYEEDEFCGSCGAILLPDFQDSAITEEIPSQPRSTQHTPQYTSSNNSTRLLVLVASAGLLLILLGGIGAIALTGVNPIASVFGGSATAGEESEDSPEAATPPPATEEETVSDLATEDAVQTFVADYYSYVDAEDWSGTYSLLDQETQAEFSEEEWITVQRGWEAQNDNPPADARGIVNIYGDNPAYGVDIRVDYTNGETNTVYKELSFENGEYKRHFTEEEIASLEPFRTDQSDTSTSELEAEAEEAANDYYQAAGIDDWAFTYDNLAAETQSLFSEEEWSQKNQWYADQDDTIYHIESVDLTEQSLEANPVVDVEVRLTGEDGSSFVRDTAFTLEDGSWKHIFLEEEIQSFRPDLTYEEFLEVQ